MIKYLVKFETVVCFESFQKKYEIDPTINSLLIKSMVFATKDITYRKNLFNNKRIEQGHLQGLPRFSKEKGSYLEFELIFSNDTEANEFIQDNNIFKKSNDKSFWYTLRQARYKDCYYTDDNPQFPTTPIYIPSKGRWAHCYTAHALLEMGINTFKIIVESQEYDEYSKVFNPANLLILPQEYFDNFKGEPTLNKELMGCGSPPARNFAWQHSMSEGHSHHIIIDDNVHGFCRPGPGNFRIPVKSPTMFKVWEDLHKSSSNVMLSALNYRFFFAADRPVYILNSRVYSIIMIDNSLWDEGVRWRVSRNEDTVLSIDVLKKGYDTLLINSFLGNKNATLKTPGGNTANVYGKYGGTEYKSEVLYNEHPDVVQLTEKWGRPHHHVDYKKHFNSGYRQVCTLNLTPKEAERGLYLKSDIRDDFYPQCLI